MAPTPQSSVMTHAVIVDGGLRDDRVFASTELLVEDGVHVAAPPGAFVGEVVQEISSRLSLTRAT